MLAFINKFCRSMTRKSKNRVVIQPKILAAYQTASGKIQTTEVPYGVNIIFLVPDDTVRVSRVDEHLLVSAVGYDSLLLLRFFRPGCGEIPYDFILVDGVQVTAGEFLKARGIDCSTSRRNGWGGTTGFVSSRIM